MVQSRCINCHVEGGASSHTRLVLTPSDTDGHEATNLAVFQNFLETVEGGADLILNKIQGAESHGGGVQVVSGSTDFANMERFSCAPSVAMSLEGFPRTRCSRA